MKYSYRFTILHFFFILILSFRSYGQARSGVGIAYGPNKPFSNDYNWGSGIQVLGNIALSDKWAIEPNLGYDKLDSKQRIYYDPANFNNKRITDIDLFYLGASGKYYFNSLLFAKAGAILYAAGGNEDIAAAGIGGNIAGGVNLNVDAHSTIELSLYTSVINIHSGGNGITPVAGFKVAYVFNFTGINKD